MNDDNHAWSIKRIDSEPIPKVPKELLPWLIKDRKEAVEGSYHKNSEGKIEHDGSGLEKAEQSFKRAKASLEESKSDPKIVEFLTYQMGAAEGKVAFYKGKVYLLDKIIASLK